MWMLADSASEWQVDIRTFGHFTLEATYTLILLLHSPTHPTEARPPESQTLRSFRDPSHNSRSIPSKRACGAAGKVQFQLLRSSNTGLENKHGSAPHVLSRTDCTWALRTGPELGILIHPVKHAYSARTANGPVLQIPLKTGGSTREGHARSLGAHLKLLVFLALAIFQGEAVDES